MELTLVTCSLQIWQTILKILEVLLINKSFTQVARLMCIGTLVQLKARSIYIIMALHIQTLIFVGVSRAAQTDNFKHKTEHTLCSVFITNHSPVHSHRRVSCREHKTPPIWRGFILQFVPQFTFISLCKNLAFNTSRWSCIPIT